MVRRDFRDRARWKIESWRTNVDEADDFLAVIEAELAADVVVVSVGAGEPDRTEAERIGREQHVVRGRTGRQDLLNFRYLGALDRARHHYHDQRRA